VSAAAAAGSAARGRPWPLAPRVQAVAGRTLLLVLVAGHAALSLWPALSSIRHDFATYYVSARAVAEGRSLHRAYERDWFQEETRRAGIDRLASFVPHPPANALLLLPLAALPPLAAKAAWTLVLVAALLASMVLLARLSGLPVPVTGALLLVSTAALRNALLYGQPYPLLLLLLCLALTALLRGHPYVAGLALAPVLVLKLYGLPFLARFLWTRRWREAVGMLAGAGMLLVLGAAVLGWPVHATYVREVLPATLAGEIQDPYAPSWNSLGSLAHRLFQHEPDLNPRPLLDAPAVARALARGAPVAVLLLAVLLPRQVDPRREWTALSLAALAASPLTSTYHFLLLALPVALLLGTRPPRALALAAVAMLVFATSPLPHFFAPLAAGGLNLLAYPRLWAVLALLGVVLRGLVTPRSAALAVAGGALAAVSALAPRAEQPWARVDEARGYLLAEPVACEGGMAWVTLRGERLVVRAPDGTIVEGAGGAIRPQCADGRFSTSSGPPPEEGGERRHLRASPDGEWVVYQAWRDGSWDVEARHLRDGRVVRLTRERGHEVEPSWMPSGRDVVFAADRRRGLGSTALYRVPFAP
jgi:hypothetical protein